MEWNLYFKWKCISVDGFLSSLGQETELLIASVAWIAEPRCIMDGKRLFNKLPNTDVRFSLKTQFWLVCGYFCWQVFLNSMFKRKIITYFVSSFLFLRLSAAAMSNTSTAGGKTEQPDQGNSWIKAFPWFALSWFFWRPNWGSLWTLK